MEEDQIYYLFPTPVLVFKYPYSYENELNFIREIELHEDQLMCSTINSQSKDTFILNKPKFKNIKDFIEIKLNYISKELFKYTSDLIITQSWINRSLPKESHGRHWHPNSVISGTMYLEIAEDSPPIRFHNSIVREISLDSTEPTEFNGTSYSLLPKKSDIIFFPSNLYHDVPENESNSSRISLSFNSWPKGSFGSEKYLTYVPN